MRGISSLVGMLVAALLAVVLIVFYMKTSIPSPDKAKEARTAIDAAKRRASEVERSEAEHFKELGRQLDEAGQ
jgi:hypothetical protein